MKWELREIAVGDMVRVPMAEVHHYGICTSEDRIVEFGRPVIGTENVVPREQITVGAVDIKTFLAGEFAEVAVFDRKELKQKRTAQQIAEYAENSIGRGGYDILYNNCEHFANECVFGKAKSSTVDDVRDEIEKKLPLINVYIGKIRDFSENNVFPSYVKKELKKISNPEVAERKKAAYGLMDFAFRKEGKGFRVKKCFLSESGKPLHKDFCFSVSHSGNLVAVAVSAAPVGIDIEVNETNENTEKLGERILCGDEKMAAPLVLWTLKEAAFKFSGKDSVFDASKVDTSEYTGKSWHFSYGDRAFIVSVVSDCLLRMNFHKLPENETLKVEEIKD